MKKFIICLLLTAAALNVSAYDVDREELESNKQEVEFINFTGIHDKIDTRKEIHSIGTSLGQDIKGSQSASLSGKYRVLHLVDPTEPEKLGADLFILEKHAGVDHIRNLRLILSGYLKAAYGYSESDASLLAEFVTYYNAVFRGKMDFFESKYNNMVLTNITAENAGIDINYKNWPGKTRMVIPLKNVKAGDAPALSAKELAEEEVIEDLRQNEDKGIEPRKEMVELREKELDKELEEAADKEEALVTEKEKVVEEKEKVEEEIKELEEKKEAGEVSEEEYKEEKKELEEKKEEIAEQEDDLDKEIEKVKEETAAVEEEKAEIAEERESIAADTNNLLENEDVPEDTSSVTGSLRSTDTFFIAVLNDSDGKYGELLLIDNKTGKADQKSDIKKIGIRGVSESSSSSILLAGSDNGSEYFLMKVDTNTLELKARSEVQVYRDTVISEKSGSIFAVINDSGKYKIGKFSESLALESSSDDEVLEDTFIIQDTDNKKLYYQNSKGDIKSIDSSSLKAAE